MSDTKRKWWLLPILALLLTGGGWLFYQWMFPPFTPPQLPTPNGYDELIILSKVLSPKTSSYDELAPEELATVVRNNAATLQRARQALQTQCLVPIDWSADQNGLAAHLNLGTNMRKLARGFMAAARHARYEGNTNEAVSCGLDIIALAPAVANGGLVVDREMAKGVYYGAMYSLREQVDQLTRDDCLRLREQLQSSPLKLEDPHDFLRRERAFLRQVHGSAQMLMMAGLARSQAQQALEMMKQSETRIKTLNLLLQTHLALRAYQLDHNLALPEKLVELIPTYLDELPLDEFAADQPLTYLREVGNYRLYSVGPNGVDDHGIEDTTGKGGDLLLELTD